MASRFDVVIEEYGYSVTLKTVTLPAPNTTAGETYADSTIKVTFSEPKIFNRTASVQGLYNDTILVTGDLIAYVKSDQAIKKRDIIVYDSANWEVDSVNPNSFKGAIWFKKVVLKRQ